MKRHPVALALWVLIAHGVIAQTKQARPVFEVASVKAIDGFIRDHEGQQLTATTFFDRTDLLQLIARAYLDASGTGVCYMKVALGVDCPLIVGTIPAWVKNDKFEIQAKLPAALSAETVERLSSTRSSSSRRRNVDPLQFKQMLQTLLEDRFRLMVHRETRDLPAWALTRGKGELKLKKSTAIETRPRADGSPVAINGLGLVLKQGSHVTMTFQASTMTDVADSLTTYLDRPVVNRTGLDGEFEFTIAYEPDPDAPPNIGRLPVNPGLNPSRAAVALEDVGLKLESSTAPFEVLVIDRLERPSSN
jgi:uncharacterized protein (TIGR03435 family)